MKIHLERAYDPPAATDGCRILVERLWPRGVAKNEARIDLWAKDAAPSTELRKWFAHDPDKWPEFRRRYRAELRANEPALEPIRERLKQGRVTFVFGSREERLNSAVVLKEFLEEHP